MKKIIIFIFLLIVSILWLEFFTKSWTYTLLDSVFYPINSLWNFFENSLYWHFHDLISMIFWYKLFSKIYIILILIIWSILWVQLSNYVWNKLNIKNTKTNFLIQCLWVFFILCNPFIYERLITQLWIALWIFVVWFWILNILKFIDTSKNKYLYYSALNFAISLSIFPHTVVFIALVFIIFSLIYFKKLNIKLVLKSWLILLLLNLNLIVPLFLKWTNQAISSVQTFSSLNIDVFQSNSLSNLWPDLTWIFLYWFWWEKGDRIFTPNLINEKWYIAWIFVLLFVLFWIFKYFKKDKKQTLFLVLLGIFAFILWIWISGNIFTWFNELLYKYIPYYTWMREPQKLLGILMFVYAFFFLIWVIELLNLLINVSLKNKLELNKYIFNSYIYFLILISFIFSWSPNILFWFNGQLKIIDYPKEYFEAKEFIQQNNFSKNLLFPWHSYMWCSWNYWRSVANIYPSYLWKDIIISAENIEIWSLYTNNSSQISTQIETFLKTKDLSILKNNNIKTIILQKTCADFKSYNFLYEINWLEQVFNTQNLDIFKIK